MDPSIRDLERMASSGDPTVEAALLTARMRAGSLSLAGLELAAYLGHPPARLALGPSVHCRGPRLGGWAGAGWTQDDLDWSDVKAWIQGLERWGVPTLVRALVALGRVAQRELLRAYPMLTSVPRALDVTEAWCDAPGEETAARLRPARDEVEREVERLKPLELYDPRGQPTRVSALHDAAVSAVEAAARAVGRQADDWDGPWFGGDWTGPREYCSVPVRFLAPDEVEAVIREGLLPLALDPRALEISLTFRPQEPA